jgi:fermentation-respiration switch protein FrsA (DUF1100 family)
MIDLHGHGESPGKRITMGYLEQHDVQAAVEFARHRNPHHRIGVVGCSLGGAASLFGSPLGIDALVLESVYPTIRQAVDNRISVRLGPLSHIITPALLCQLRPRLGVSESDLRPIDRLASVGCPILLATGELDRHTTLAETRHMFDTARSPKELVVFPGAAHVDLYSHDPGLYVEKILSFLNARLRPSHAVDVFPNSRRISAKRR